MLSIVIPTLNEATSIDRLLSALAQVSAPVEVIVVDGGSEDDTLRNVREHGVKLLEAERGRGTQMRAGARASQGEVLWFLHADTLPPPEALGLISRSLEDPEIIGGSFNVHFDSQRFAAHFLSWFYRELRGLGICYGDSGIFVRRHAYESVGGFRSVPIFEDLDLVHRLRRIGHMAHVPGAVTTSSRRFEGRSFSITFAKWTFLQVLYWLGVSPQVLGRWYAPVREARST